MFPVSHVHKHDLLGARDYTLYCRCRQDSPSILHSTLEAKAKIDLEKGSGDFFCLSIGTESLAAALNTRCRPLVY